MLLEFLHTHLGEQDLLNIALVEHTIDETRLSQFFGQHIADSLVGQRFERLDRDVTRSSDVLHLLIPDIAQIGLDLQAVGITDVLDHIRLNSALELSYTENLHLDVELVEQPFRIGQHARHTVEGD